MMVNAIEKGKAELGRIEVSSLAMGVRDFRWAREDLMDKGIYEQRLEESDGESHVNTYLKICAKTWYS